MVSVSGSSSGASKISFGGLASGIDTTAILDALIAAEQRPILLAQAKLAGQQQRQAAITAISDSIASLASAAAALNAIERRALAAQRTERMALMREPLCGERTIADAARAIELALQCAETRNLGIRRRAGLLHRRAWIERSRGDEAAELVLLERTREAYRVVYERDPDIQDASAARVAYLIGDLHLRLGDLAQARRWLLECIQMKGVGAQEGLLRMARLRLDDIRDASAGSFSKAV